MCVCLCMRSGGQAGGRVEAGGGGGVGGGSGGTGAGLTSVRRVTKMKAPAESGQASWDQISRTWLKQAVTSSAEQLCLSCSMGSSCPPPHNNQ